jgi:hypothetical protein
MEKRQQYVEWGLDRGFEFIEIYEDNLLDSTFHTFFLK